MKTTTERTIKIIKRYGPRDADIKPNTNLMHNLDFDSLDIIECIMGIEDEFEIEIFDEEVERIETVQDIIAIVNQRNTK